MRNRLALLIAGALALLLGACNTQTQAPGGGEAQKSKVTVSVAFPQRDLAPQGLSPQGVPRSAESAEVKVYDSQNQVVNTVTLTRDNPGAIIVLENGNYTFEVSVKNANGTEVAWKKEVHDIQSDTYLLLVPKAILGEAWLSHNAFVLNPGETMNLRLWVVEPEGSEPNYFPLDDYEVTYAVGTCSAQDCSDFAPTTAATIVSEQKTGVKIAANNVSQNTTIYVRATVTGLGPRPSPGADPQITTLVRYSQAITVAASPSSGVGVALDLNPPWVYLDSDSPSYGAQVPLNQPVTFSGGAQDNETGIREVKVYVNSEELTNVQITPTYSQGNVNYQVDWQFSFTPTTPGRYDIDIVAFDNAGNSYRPYTYAQAQ